MNKSLVKLIVSILLLSFMGSVHSETERDRQERYKTESLQKIERSRTLVGKDYWFDLPRRTCSLYLVSNPIKHRYNEIEGESIKGTLIEVVGDGSIEGDKFIESKYTFFKIHLSDDRTVYMDINHFLSELDSLKEYTDLDMDSLMCVYPENPDDYWKKVKDQRIKEKNKISEKEPKSKSQKSKKPGVRLGMTPNQVINETSWGKPLSVNRTTNQSGVHEQWVYGDGNYLYFDNGKLTSIQN